MIYGRFSVHRMDNIECKYIVFDNEKREEVASFRFKESNRESVFDAIANAEKKCEELNKSH